MINMKQCYKQTEMGIIPEDWEYTTWNEIATGFSSGATPFRGNKSNYEGTVNWVTSGELKYNIINNTVEHISELAKKKANLTLHPPGVFLMAITGLEAEGTRGSCAILGVSSTTNQSCMAIYPSEKLDIHYLFHYYVQRGNELALKYCQGTKQQSYTSKIVKQLPIVLPSLSEQHRIAETISDVDELIFSLDKLIEKKKALKQGVMQELLTGKRRLPGFSGEWKEYRIGDMGDFYSGLSGKSKADFEKGTSKFITFLNVLSNTVIDASSLGIVDIKNNEQQNKVKKGDLFFNSSSETPDEVGMCSVLNTCLDNTYLNSFCFGYRLKNDAHCPLFLSYYFNSFIGRKIMTILAQGATRYNLSKNSFADTLIKLPQKNEQLAISSALLDSEIEISNLRKKLAKIKKFKYGMMSELLTGRIRLV